MQEFLELIKAILICIIAGVTPIIGVLAVIFSEQKKEEEKLPERKRCGNGK